MSTTFDPPLRHPVLACADSIEAALKETGDVEVAFMRSEDKRAALLQLSRVEAQLSALRLRLMAASDDVALDEGARDVAALVTHLTRTDGGTNRRDLVLAESLDCRWSQVATALAAGDVNLAQARVIVHALDELPARPVSRRRVGAGRGPPGRGGGALRAAGAAGAGTSGARRRRSGGLRAARGRACWPRRSGWRGGAPRSRAPGWATASPGSPSTCPTPWPRGCAPTWRRSPRRDTDRRRGRAIGCRSTYAAGRRSVRCWRRTTRDAFPCTAATPPR